MTTPDPSFFIWLDPGETTGAAWYDMDTDRFGSGQYDATELMSLLADMVAEHGDRLAIGWELYNNTARSKGTAKYSLEVIGATRVFCEQQEVTVLKGQPSSARNLQGTVIFLRRLGWYRKGKRHANDAAAHLFRWLIRMRPVPEKIRKRLPAGY
jgi:hypothetical protein